MSEAEQASGARLRAVLAAAELPSSVRRAWTERPPTPAPGQVWRARWGTMTQLLLVLDAPARSVRAAPVTLDPDLADNTAVILPADSTVLTVPLVVWLGDTMSLPLRVLDRVLGSVTIDLREVPEARRGRPVLTPADDRAVHRARLQDVLGVFVAARWAPDGNGNLGDILGKTTSKRVSEALELSDREVIALRRGRMGLTPDQAVRLASVAEESVENLLAANPRLPDDLVADLDLPAYRAKVNALAQRRGIDEVEAWLTAGYSVAGVAHRQTEGEAPSWRERLDRYFDAVLDEQ